MTTGPRRRRPAALRALPPLLAAAAALACATPGLPPPEERNSVASPYVIGAADMIQVRVWKSPELSVEVPVRPDGMISVPLLDDVQAAGLTAEQLKEVIAEKLAEFISNPDVTVVVSSMQSKRIYVLGGVARPGPVLLATDTRVTDALAQAGGFTTFASRDAIRIIRRTEDGEVEYGFDYDAYIKGRAPGTNMILRPGDTLVVPD
jgi:polysaccharide export outer membrane protein